MPTRATTAHPGGPDKVLFIALPFSQQRTTTISNAIHLLTLNLIRGDETPIFQHLQRRIDRSRAGCIETAGLLFQGLHHFIAMHWTLLQELQQGKFHIAASKKAASFPTGTKWPTRTKMRTPWASVSWAKWPTSPVHSEKSRTSSLPPLILKPWRRPTTLPSLMCWTGLHSEMGMMPSIPYPWMRPR